MGEVFVFLFWLAAAVLLLLLAGAFVPLSAVVSVSRHDRTHVRVEPSWGRFRLPPLSLDFAESSAGPGRRLSSPRASPALGRRRERRRRPSRKAAGRRASGGMDVRRLRRVFGTPGLTGVVRATMGRLLKSLRPRHLQLSITFGLGDPFETARLLSFLSPAWALLLACQPGGVWIEPDFTRRRLDIEGSAVVRFVPADLLIILLRGVTSRATLTALGRATAS